MLLELGENAKKATKEIGQLSEDKKNIVLKEIAEALIENTKSIIEANQKDLDYAVTNQIGKALLDRLLLNEERIIEMTQGLYELIDLKSGIGEILEVIKRPNGLLINKKRVPLGVIGIIYEARPNVTVDAFGLCFKSSNCVILRGGKEAIHSNTEIVRILRSTLEKNSVNINAVQLVTDTSRDSANALMKMNGYLDLLIPRGGQGLIQAVLKNSTVPVIQTGAGNCHVYVDECADIEMAVDITYNAKVQRPGVCNSCETVIVHSNIAPSFLTQLGKRFDGIVEVRGDKRTMEHIPYASKATLLDYETEFHDFIISIIVVDSLDQALEHIETYSTRHSEAIITENKENAQRFLDEVDSSAVYVNASTRFTDGYEFGYGAEMGISTQKLHARGPMGLKELTSIKYVIYGTGQVRN